MYRILFALVVVAAALTSGCNITAPDLLGQDGVVANDSDATMRVEIRWLPPRGTDGYRDPKTYELGAPAFGTTDLSEGKYEVSVYLSATGERISQKTLFIPAERGERDFAYEEVQGMPPTMFHWGIVVSGTYRHYRVKIES